MLLCYTTKVDNEIEHYPVVSDPPFNTEYLDVVRPCRGFALNSLEKEFSEDPEALAANILILLGLAARASEHIELHGNDSYLLLGEPSQSVYVSLLERLLQTSDQLEDTDEMGSVYAQLHNRLECEAFFRHSRAITQRAPEEFRSEFNKLLARAIELKLSCHYEGKRLSHNERSVLKNIRNVINAVSNDFFIELTKERADQVMTIETQGVNLELLEKFCEPTYWENLRDNLLVEETLGDTSQSHRLQKISTTYLLWIRDQVKYVSYKRQLAFSESGHSG